MASKFTSDAGAITGRMAVEWQIAALTASPCEYGGQWASVSALFIEDSNALSADAGVTNCNAATSTSNLNILPPNPLRHLSHAARLSIFVLTLDLDQQTCARP
jgi:hypothetical protein